MASVGMNIAPSTLLTAEKAKGLEVVGNFAKGQVWGGGANMHYILLYIVSFFISFLFYPVFVFAFLSSGFCLVLALVVRVCYCLFCFLFEVSDYSGLVPLRQYSNRNFLHFTFPSPLRTTGWSWT